MQIRMLGFEISMSLFCIPWLYCGLYYYSKLR